VKDINVTFGEKKHKPWRKSTILGKRKRSVENDDKKRWKKKSIFWKLFFKGYNGREVTFS